MLLATGALDPAGIRARLVDGKVTLADGPFRRDAGPLQPGTRRATGGGRHGCYTVGWRRPAGQARIPAGLAHMTATLDLSVFDRDNLVAWCIVAYDTRHRTARERATMLAGLGIGRLAWDWRPEHLWGLSDELDALIETGIELTAFWAPHLLPEDDAALGRIDPTLRSIMDQIADRSLAPQLWACTELGAPGPFPRLPAGQHAARVHRTAAHVAPLVELAGQRGMRVALYNHMGWFGEPENQIEVIEALAGRGRVGLVYQQHHGHAHLDRFERLMPAMAPRLDALGITGMVPGAHWGRRKIHPYGRGFRDVELARAIARSGWHGPVSVLSHTMDDAAIRLRDNLDGLDWVLARLREDPDAPVEPPPARIPKPAWPH